MNKKKLLALLLALVMTLSLVPVTALAEFNSSSVTWDYLLQNEYCEDVTSVTIGVGNVVNAWISSDTDGYKVSYAVSSDESVARLVDYTYEDDGDGHWNVKVQEEHIQPWNEDGELYIEGVSEGIAYIEQTIVDENDAFVDKVAFTVIVGDSIFVSATGVSITEGYTKADAVIGTPFTLHAVVSPENATYNTVTWSTEDASVATISQDGNTVTVTPVAVGTVGITATCDGPNPHSAVYSLTVTAPATNYVAQIGDTKYETLAAAVAAVPANGTATTITMIADYEAPMDHSDSSSGGYNVVNIAQYQNVILDLNGKTITGVITYEKNSAVITVSEYGTLTIRDSSSGQIGKITHAKYDDGVRVGNWADQNYQTDIIFNHGGTLTIEGGTIANTANGNICYAIDNSNNYRHNNATLIITGGTITSQYCEAIRMRLDAPIYGDNSSRNIIDVSGGTISGRGGIWAQVASGAAPKGSLTITGGTITGGDWGTLTYSAGANVSIDDFPASISGGKIAGSVGLPQEKYISGGVFSEEIDENKVAEGKTPIANTDEDTKNAYPYTVGTATTAVAQIGDVTYPTLAAAIAAVPDGTATTIEMIADSAEPGEITIAAGKNITLDLAGHEISYTENASGKSVYFLTNKGELTIQDTSVNGNGNIVFTATPNSTSYSYETVTIYNLGGTLNFASGKITNASGGGLAYAVNNSSNAWANSIVSTFNMTGGTISAPTGDAALRVYQNCAIGSVLSKNYVNIFGGTIYDTGIFVDTYLYTTGKDATNYEGNNIETIVNIEGGTINGLVDLKIRHPFHTSLNISGGNFSYSKLWVRKVANEYATAGSITEPAAPLVNISGGKWNFVDGKAFGLAYDCGTSSWTSYEQPYSVTDGVFNKNLNDYDSIKFEDGKTGIANTAADTKDAYPYTVGTEASCVAQIGNVKYETLDAALTAANLGETVKLLADVSVSAIVEITKSITLDGNNHTLTTTATRGIWIASSDVAVTIENMEIVSSNNKMERSIQVNTNCDKVTLNLNNITTTATDYTVNVCGSVDDLELNINDCDLTGWGAVNLWGNNGTVNISGSTLTGINDKGYNADGWNNFGVVVMEGDTTGQTQEHSSAYNVEISNSTIVANSTTGNTQFVLVHNNPSVNNAVTLTDCQIVLNDSCEFLAEDSEGFSAIDKVKGTYLKDSNNTLPTLPEGFIYVDLDDGYKLITRAVAQIGDDESKQYPTLEAAITAAQNGETVKLLADVQLSQGVDVGKNVTLDLNGKTISNASDITDDYLLDVLHGGTLTVDDSSATSSGKISMDEQYCAIKMTKAGNTADFVAGHPATLIVNAGTIEGPDYAISGNGNDGRGNSVITINDGTICSTAGTAIYQPNTGVVTLNGGTITGLTGVEVRSGSLNIPKESTAVITGTGTPASISGNGNGTTTDGAGVAIAQHTTHHDIDVTIAGGTISGQYSLAIVNPNNQTQGSISASVTGGKFSGNLEVTETRVANFISGGIFSAKPAAAYIATGFAAMDNGDNNTNTTYPYKVDKMKVVENQNATVTVTVDKQVDVSGDQVPADVKSNETLKTDIRTNTSVSGVALTNNLTTGTTESNGVQAVVNTAKNQDTALATALNTATTVEVKVDVTVVPTEYTESMTFTFSLTPTATVTTKDENGDETATVSGVEVSNDMIDQTQDIEVTLYTGFEPALLTHRDDLENVIGSYTKGDTASDSTFTYDTEKGTCKLIIHHFSTIEATASSGAASVDFEGGSLRRRVLTSDYNTVVRSETDFRMKFAFNLPTGAEVITDNSYFYWSTSNENPTASDRKIQITSINSVDGTSINNVNYSNWAAMIIKGVPSSAFETPIYCKMHLEYELNGKTYAVEMSANKTVNQIANGLAALDSTVNTNLKWIEYGKYLLGNRESYTLSEFN